MIRTSLVGIFVLAICNAVAAQSGGGLPGGLPGGGVCSQVAGSFSVTSVDGTSVEIGLTGDVSGTVNGAVNSFSETPFGSGTLTTAHFSGSVSTANGSLDVTGQVFQVNLSAIPMPGGMMTAATMGPVGSVTFVRLTVTGGTGDYDGNFGVIFGFENTIMGDSMGSTYRGVLCDISLPPQP